VAALGCSTLRTTVDYDPATDFSRFHTFTFRAPPADRTPRSQERIEAFIADALEARGLARASEESADLRVYTKVILDHRHENDNFAYGYGSRPGGGLVVTPGRDVSLGTLLVDLVDVQRQELVWRGRAADVLEPDREARDQQLRTAITRMFARYPSPPGR
jgi:hypothetical protein